MFIRANVKPGMTVRSADGKRLGRVVAQGSGQFEVQRGYFFPRVYLASYGDIADVRRHAVILRHGQDDLRGVSGRGIVSEDGMGALSAEARGSEPTRRRGAAQRAEPPGAAPGRSEDL